MTEIRSIYTSVNPQTKGPSFEFLIDITDNGTLTLIVRAQEQVLCNTHGYIQTRMIYNAAKHTHKTTTNKEKQQQTKKKQTKSPQDNKTLR